MDNKECRSGRDQGKRTGAGDFRRVTGGVGGEALLIIGSEKTALYDTGMAFCAPELIENIQRELAPLGRPLDYVLLSHTHYDHTGGLPYLRRQWPALKVFGSAYGEWVLRRESALQAMRRLSETAAVTFRGEGSTIPPYSDEELKIDCVVGNGDTISLGDRVFKVYETPGHTNCSLTFFLEGESILLPSESSGVYSFSIGMHTPVLTGYRDACRSVELCRSLGAKYIYSPHSLLVPEEVAANYWNMTLAAMEELKDFILDGRKQGLPPEEILERCKRHYWRKSVEHNQPFEAFIENMKAEMDVILREFPQEADTL